MKIESAVYRVMYKRLCDKMVKIKYKENPPKFKSENRGELFEKRIEGEKIGIRLLQNSNIHDLKYIYRRFTELSTDTIRGEINPQILYNILFELGYKLDEKYVDPKANKDESVPISKAQNLLHQFISTHPADIRDEQNKVDPAYYINSPNITKNKIDTGNEKVEIPEFSNAVKVISNFYGQKKKVLGIDDFNPDNSEFLFWGSNDCDFEVRQFNRFMSALDARNSVLNSGKPFGYIRQALEFSFLRYIWLLYELQGDKIIERKIRFLIDGDSKERKHIHPTGVFCSFELLEEDNKTQGSYHCLMDFLHKSIQINGSGNSKDDKKTTYFNFSYVDNNWTLDQCIGHKIMFRSEKGAFESKVIALCKSHEEKYEQPFFIKRDLNDSAIPATIRAFLSYPTEIKNLPNPYLNLSDTICWMFGKSGKIR